MFYLFCVMTNVSATHPSKIFKYCPRCGQQGFTFDGKKLFTCAACDFHFYINPATAVAVIIVLPDNRIVLTRRRFDPKAGTFDLPGGFVDIGERVEEAVKRELNEELGIEIETIRFLDSFPNEYSFKGFCYFTSDLAFVCTVKDISKLKAADDVSEAIFVSTDAIDFNQISFPSIVNILKAYIAENYNIEKN